MKCNFQETSEVHASGRTIWKCDRRGCSVIGLEPPSGRLFAECEGFPDFDDWGSWIAFCLKLIGLDQRTWNNLRRWLGFKKPCTCPQTEEKLNSLGRRCYNWLFKR